MGDDCRECEGEGSITTSVHKECKQCEGAGSVAAGRSGSSRYVCPVCAGSGGADQKSTKVCSRCKGTGKRRNAQKAPDEMEGDVVGKRVLEGGAAPKAKAKAKSTDPQPVAPAAGSGADGKEGHDVEAGGEDEERARKESDGGSDRPRFEINISMIKVGTVIGSMMTVIGFALFMKGSSVFGYIAGALLCLAGSWMTVRLQYHNCVKLCKTAAGEVGG